MSNRIVLCGGTGAHVGIAFLRLHTLGHALGYFSRAAEGKSILPSVYIVDQDDHDSDGESETAHQVVSRLIEQHPSKDDWARIGSASAAPELRRVKSVPIGGAKNWHLSRSTIQEKFGTSSYFPLFFRGRLEEIDFSKGMIASPSAGSFLFRLKLLDRPPEVDNHDDAFSHLAQGGADARTVVVGSGVGGTGASVAPVLAEHLADRGHSVLALMLLNWFELTSNNDQAVRRNELLRQNAASALRYYGTGLGKKVAAAAIGVPSAALVKRTYSGDMAQKKEEAYIHAVGAIAAWQQITSPSPLSHGLYLSGAVDVGRIDPYTAIGDWNLNEPPTLQELANRAQTLSNAMGTLIATLGAHHGRVRPAIVKFVRSRHPSGLADVVKALRARKKHYDEQISWMRTTLDIQPQSSDVLDLESAWRERLKVEAEWPSIGVDHEPDRVAGLLFDWLGRWVVASAKRSPLHVRPGEPARVGYLPDVQGEGGGAPWTRPGVLVKAAVPNITMKALVETERIAVSGWPHPFAPADYFRDAIDRENPLSVRQLEMLLIGLHTGILDMQPVARVGSPDPLSIEGLLKQDAEYGPWKGLARYRVVHGRTHEVYGAYSPFTLLFPAPIIDNRAEAWESLWNELTGTTNWDRFDEGHQPAAWHKNGPVAGTLKSWVAGLRQEHGAATAPKWTEVVFKDVRPLAGDFSWGAQHFTVFWSPNPPHALKEPPATTVDILLPFQGAPPAGVLDGKLDADEPLYREVILAGGTELPAAGGYELVRARLMGDKVARSYVWSDHLDALAKDPAFPLQTWSRAPDGKLLVFFSHDGNHYHHVVTDVEVLDLREVLVHHVPVFLDESHHGTHRLVLPEVPIKARYLPLLMALDGSADTLSLWKEANDAWDHAGQQPMVKGDKATWKLRLLGRSGPHTHQATLLGGHDDPNPADVSFQKAAPTAHIMVWPRFRPRHPSTWRAYYVRTLFGLRGFDADVLWVAADGALQSVAGGGEGVAGTTEAGTLPISWDQGQHRGGPPIAITLLHKRGKEAPEEAGLLLVRLKVLEPRSDAVEMAVDFGTSHSTAAWMKGRDRRSVDIGPDLDDEGAPLDADRLTLHVLRSQRLATQRVLRQGRWLPSYTSATGGFVPSTLVLSRSLTDLRGKLAELVPGRDYVVGSLDFGGRGGNDDKLDDYLLSGFKWADSGGAALSKADRLRMQRVYLQAFLELVVAQVALDAGGVPTGGGKVTFTWPLRETDEECLNFQTNCREALKFVRDSLGTGTLDAAFYDESSSARLTEGDGQIVIVADLGGGTLDIHVSRDESNAAPGPQVSDSLRLGGGEILRRLAEDETALPAHWPAKDRMHLLEQWMRVNGPQKLYGSLSGDFSLPSAGAGAVEIKTYSGSESKRKERALRMVTRYFGLIEEVLARYLVAFVEHNLGDPERVSKLSRAVLQLRGNGWKLHPLYHHHDTKLARLATDRVGPSVQARARQLWTDIHPDSVATIQFSDLAGHHDTDPKREPIKQALGKDEEPTKTREMQRRHALVSVNLIANGGLERVVPWHEPEPFDPVDGHDVARARLPSGGVVEPPIPLAAPGGTRPDAIHKVEVVDANRINESLSGRDALLSDGRKPIPVAAIVWEQLAQRGAFKGIDEGEPK